MRAQPHIARVLIVSFFSCAYYHDAAIAQGIGSPELPGKVLDPLAGAGKYLLDFDLVQRTCALYVAIRSAAFESPVEFGRDVDDTMVHWNMCPGGTMVACVATPTANGDTIVTGIPWPY